MKTLFVERFTLKDFIRDFLTEENLNLFKRNLAIYKKTEKSDYITEALEFLIYRQHKDKFDCFLDTYAIDFFNYVFDKNVLISINNIIGKKTEEWITEFLKTHEYLKKICGDEKSKRYWKTKSIEEDYVNEDIVITDKCYFFDYEQEGYIQPPCDLSADTIYGDWSCSCYNKDTKEKIGCFCADSGNVCVAKLKDILEFNPSFEKWIKEHNWCVTVIKNFTGKVFIKYDIERYEYNGEQHRELICYIEGTGNINFTTRQTGF